MTVDWTDNSVIRFRDGVNTKTREDVLRYREKTTIDPASTPWQAWFVFTSLRGKWGLI